MRHCASKTSIITYVYEVVFPEVVQRAQDLWATSIMTVHRVAIKIETPNAQEKASKDLSGQSEMHI